MTATELPQGLEEKLIQLHENILTSIKSGATRDELVVLLEDLFTSVSSEQFDYFHDNTPYLPNKYFDFFNYWFRPDSIRPDGVDFNQQVLKKINEVEAKRIAYTLPKSPDIMDWKKDRHNSLYLEWEATRMFGEDNPLRDLMVYYGHHLPFDAAESILNVLNSRLSSFFKKRNKKIHEYLIAANAENHTESKKRKNLNIIGKDFHKDIEEFFNFADYTAQKFSILSSLVEPWYSENKYFGRGMVWKNLFESQRDLYESLAKLPTEVFDKKTFFDDLISLFEESHSQIDPIEAIEIASLDIPDYRISRILGEGADGVVYQAQHNVLGDVKIKLFKEPEDKVKQALDLEGVTTEDRIRARMENIKEIVDKSSLVEFYGVGTCRNPRNGEDTFYLVLEYVDVGSVETKKDGEYVIREDITGDVVMSVFTRFLKGLGAIHEAGKVLKDVKLRNLLVSYDHKTVKLDDLETIAGIDEIRKGDRLTMGSDRYAAPEVLHDITNATPQSDLYSAAVSLLYMETRDPTLMKSVNCLEGEEYDAELSKVLNSQGLTEKQALFFEKALAREPAKRYQSAQEMISALE